MLLKIEFKAIRSILTKFKIALLLSVLIISIFLACEKYSRDPDARLGEEIPVNETQSGQNTGFQHSRIYEVGVFAWWWEQKDNSEDEIPRIAPPPRTAYVTLKEWVYDGEGIKTAPRNVDLVTHLQNESYDEFTGLVRFFVRGKYENYDKLQPDKDDGNIHDDSKLSRISWSKESEVLSQRLKLASGESKRIQESDFDLRPFLLHSPESKPLCALQFEVRLETVAGDLLEQRKLTIPVRLGD